MRKSGVFVFAAIVSIFSLWAGSSCNAKEMKQDANAAKQLEMVRKTLSGLTEMKAADSKKYYLEALNDLSAIIEKYPGTEQCREAQFYRGAAYNEMHNFDDAIKCFDTVLSQGDINVNFKARTLYFKTKALIGKNDIAKAKEVVAELRTIEPRAADSFGSELSGTMRIGAEAPMFTATDIDNKTIDLAKYKGNVVLIDFWATWCDPCVREFPKMKKMYNQFKDKDVKFIGVSLDDDIEDLRGFIKQEEVVWPQIFDGKRWKGAIPSLYHIQAIPTTVVLDRENKVRYVGNDIDNITRIVTTMLTESKDMPLFR